MRLDRCLGLTLLLMACSDDFIVPGGEVSSDRTDTILALTGDATAGEAVFALDCEVCHDPAGLEVRAGPALGGTPDRLTDAQIIEIVLAGQGPMPAVDLEDQPMADLLAHIKAAFGGVTVDTDDTDSSSAPDLVNGEAIYRGSCGGCHPDSGDAGVGPGLAEAIPDNTDEQLATVIADGGTGMPGFSNITGDDLTDLIAYLRETWGS